MDLANESQQWKAKRKQFKWEDGTTVWLCEFKAMLACYCSSVWRWITPNHVLPWEPGCHVSMHRAVSDVTRRLEPTTWELTKQCTGVGNGTEVRERSGLCRSVAGKNRSGLLVAVPFTGGSCSAIWVEHAALLAAELVHFQMPAVTVTVSLPAQSLTLPQLSLLIKHF